MLTVHKTVVLPAEQLKLFKATTQPQWNKSVSGAVTNPARLFFVRSERMASGVISQFFVHVFDEFIASQVTFDYGMSQKSFSFLP